MKIWILSACITLSIIAASDVHALSTSNQLTPADAKSWGFDITVQNTENVPQSITFRITTKPPPIGYDTRWLSGHLLLVDGQNQIVSCELKKEIQDDGSIAFRFEVSRKYLRGSKFTYAAVAHSNGEPMPAFDANWFYLSDFPPKADAELPDTDLNFIYVYGNFNIDLPPHAGDFLWLSPKMLVESTELSFKTAKSGRIAVLFHTSEPFKIMDKQKEFLRLEGITNFLYYHVFARIRYKLNTIQYR